ncbi:hypothetical protein WA026_021894 [Henosepilachna vigintioctopunctata]|uniref:Uncharacterized protein n=1 Tax=Henosepilachna vigintioctopunctata TaxID=420089 RepID=A0AAW1UQ86_9CUCU
MWHKDYVTDFDSDEHEGTLIAYSLNAEQYVELNIPETIDAIENHPEKENWLEAINEELQCMEKNQTWTDHGRFTREQESYRL